ncbi:MAG: tRNA guanosine(34) transglycosylase Tgt [Pseudomonadota bacterium]
MTSDFHFKLHKKNNNARLGTVYTPRGNIETPAFMPVGTAATVKAIFPEDVRKTGADILLGNTYHLMLRPTAERIARLGGLHKFMNWDGPILTDSGGFQVMSLSGLSKLSEEGVTFASHIDGSRHMLTPERSMDIQKLLGSDIVMIFDECTPYPATHDIAKSSMELSLRWAERSKKAFGTRAGHALFGIVQGGIYEDLRHKSAAELIDIGFDGYAVGGLAVGEGQDIMFDVLEKTVPVLPEDKPRYLMGVGKPHDIIGAVKRGIDMFDCVLPTRSGRNGQLFTRNGPINIKNAIYADDPTPIEPECPCPTFQNYSKAYLHHVYKSKEIIASMLLSLHNLHFYGRMMKEIREAIRNDQFEQYEQQFLENYL